MPGAGTHQAEGLLGSGPQGRSKVAAAGLETCQPCQGTVPGAVGRGSSWRGSTAPAELRRRGQGCSMEQELPETQPGSAPPGTLIQKQGQERCQQPAVARGCSLGSEEHALPIPAAGVGDTGRELLSREGITVGRACPVSRERFGGAVGKAAVEMKDRLCSESPRHRGGWVSPMSRESQGGGAAGHRSAQRCCGVLRGPGHLAEWGTSAMGFGAGSGELQLGQSWQGWNRLRHPGAGGQQQWCWGRGLSCGQVTQGGVLPA